MAKKGPRLKADFTINVAMQASVMEDWLSMCHKGRGDDDDEYRYNLPQLLAALEPVVFDILLD